MGFDSNLQTLFGNMENFVSTKTVVGEPIMMDGITILPLVDITFGVGAGAGGKNQDGGGGGGLGAKITPSAVLVIHNGNVQLVNVKHQESLNKLIDMVPGIMSKLNFGPFKKKKETPEATVTEVTLEEKIITEPLE